jgi:polysaccharide biosynthesis/export protein
MKLKSSFSMVCSFMLLCSPLMAVGQQAGKNVASLTVPTPGPMSATAPSTTDPRLIQLGPGDSLAVHVYGQPDMDGNVYVSDDGVITLPLLGKVKVTHLSPIEAAQNIEQELKSRNLLVNPHVTLTVLQSHSQLVSVLGEVHTPGRYAINPNTSVIDVLAEAGGETENGANFVYVLRPDEQGKVHRYRVDLRGIGEATGQVSSAPLQAGDSLFVPRALQFYIYGEVATPGEYRLEPGMTVIEAVARAGGTTQKGSRRHFEVKRTDQDGHSVSISAKPDDLVEPDDNIRVKESLF